jgi:hypothetical protein
VKIRRTPSAFILTTDAEQPDDNGNFELIWTRSEFALNYSIYYSNYSISKFNESVKNLCEGFTPSIIWPIYRYIISNWKNGTYFFKIIAYNQYGNYSSNCLRVTVNIPKEKEEDTIDNDNFRFFIEVEIIISFILISLLGILIFMRSRYKKCFRFDK